MSPTRAHRRAELLLAATLVGLAVGIRLIGLHETTADMRIFAFWLTKLKAGGLSEPIGNYNAPFLYLFAILVHLPGAAIVKVKLTWFLFDALLVFFTYRIVALRYAGPRIPALAAAVMAFLPTVVVNSSVYGQCDAIWASFALGGLYYLLRERPWLGVSLMTVALAFKPQAIFIFPVLMLLVLGGRLRARTLLAVPAVFLALDLPAIIAGRDPIELLSLYSPQRQAQFVPALTQNAPSSYAFLPVTTRVDTVKHLGYAFAAVLVVGICAALIAGRARLDAKRVVTAAACFAILVPYLLPGMHERYFFLADVLTVVLAFYRPRLWFVPLLVQAASLGSYLAFLFWETPHGPFVPLQVLSALMCAALLITGYALLRDLAPRAAEVRMPERELVDA